MTRTVVFFLLVSSAFRLHSQQNEDYVLGMVLDARTQDAVPFATIRLMEKAVGTITNQDGSFRVPSRYLLMGDRLEISCLGYQARELSLSDMEPGELNVIRLVPAAIQLRESVLYGKRKKPPGPRKIIKRALERIPKNYPITPFSYVGYFRDYQLKDKDYVNLNEALLKILDMGFGTNDLGATKIQLYDYQANTDFKRDTIADGPYNYATREKIIKHAYLYDFGGNELIILRIHDAIRNYNVMTYSYVDLPEKGLIKNHSLSRKKDKLLNRERMYVIGLARNRPVMDSDQMPDATETSRFTAEGTLYISQSSYAIHRMEYKVFDTKSKKSKASKSDSSGKLIFEVTVEYKRYKDKMYPNYISFHNVFTLQKALFHIKGVSIDPEQRCFEVTLNKDPILFIDRAINNFDVRFKGRKIKLERVVPTHKGYRLYPDVQVFDEILEVVTSLYGNGQNLSPDIFEINLTGIKDAQGNDLNAFYVEEYHQFREFFTQQLNLSPNRELPEEVLMKKDAPIFENQPIIRPENFDSYWMNTPLIPQE